jgi:TonB family protein
MTSQRFLAFLVVVTLVQLMPAQTEQAAKPESQTQTEQQAKPEQPAQSAPQAKPEQPDQPKHLRISSGVAEGLKTHNVTPTYPAEARQQRIEGDVLLQAMIDTKGNITNLKVMQGNPILVKAAIEAVQKRKYRPFILKGEPVPVETTIRVQFHVR